MPVRLRNTVGMVWVGLIAVTLLSWWLGTDHGVDAETAAVSVLTIAFVKVRLVARCFMELQTAPVQLAALFDAWLIVTYGVVLVLYLSGTS